MRAAGMLALSLLPIGLVGAIAAIDDPVMAGPPSVTVTVDGADYPLCYVEDCSDQPNQIGVWRDPDTGDQFFIVGDSTMRITP